MKTVSIDFTNIKNENDFHIAFANLGVVPEYYGKNLNALWDVLTTEVAGPVEFQFIKIKNFESANKNEYDKIVKVFVDACNERQGELHLLFINS